jgi:hypothetical protein
VTGAKPGTYQARRSAQMASLRQAIDRSRRRNKTSPALQEMRFGTFLWAPHWRCYQFALALEKEGDGRFWSSFTVGSIRQETPPASAIA